MSARAWSTAPSGSACSAPRSRSGPRGSIGPCHDRRVDTQTHQYRTGDEEVVLDLTRDCATYVAGRGDGLLQLFVPHATAGIAIIETGAGSDDDLLGALADLLPA